MRRLLGVSIVLLLASACSLTPNLSGENPPREYYSVVVDYDQSLEEMIAAGNYDYVNSYITSDRFPAMAGANGQVTVKLELIHFNQGTTSEQVFAELDHLGLCPASLAELLAFGVTYPEKQREFPIVVVGSFRHGWRGTRYVLCLGSYEDERYLGLYWWSEGEGGWPEDYRFLAIRP